jgi:hypothetical protein
MNAAFYDIANSSFFDRFLKIDSVFPEEWNQRNPNNLKIITPILHSLREVIYEIRLGNKTTSDKIALMRKRHIKSLENLGDIEVITDLYLELLSYYEFEFWEFKGSIDNGPNKYELKSGNIPNQGRKYDALNVKAAIERVISSSSLPREFQTLGSLHCSTAAGHDQAYLDALFLMIDPWGKIVRYMSAALIDKAIINIENEVWSNDGYAQKLWFLVDNKFKLYYFNSELDKKHRFVIKNFQNPVSKNIEGKILDASSPSVSGLLDPNFLLVAKSKFSSNHQIAEVYHPERDEWAVYDFLNQPSFAQKESEKIKGGYKDYLHYYSRK